MITFSLGSQRQKKKTLSRDARADDKRSQLLPSASYHESGSQIINALLNRERLAEEDYDRRFGFGIGYDLLTENVVALHIDSGAITFQSRLIEKYCGK